MREDKFNEIIGAYLDGEASRSEVLALKREIDCNPERREAYRAQVRLHKATQEAFRRIGSIRPSEGVEQSSPRRFWGCVYVGSFATAVAAACIAVAVLVMPSRSGAPGTGLGTEPGALADAGSAGHVEQANESLAERESMAFLALTDAENYFEEDAPGELVLFSAPFSDERSFSTASDLQLLQSDFPGQSLTTPHSLLMQRPVGFRVTPASINAFPQANAYGPMARQRNDLGQRFRFQNVSR